MILLITGGGGYIGTELVKLLCANDKISNIIIYDNFSRRNFGLFLQMPLPNPEKIKLIDGDILDSRRLQNVLTGVDAVIHLAARVSTPYAADDSHVYEQVNHWGTAEVVYAVERAKVGTLIHASTTSVYGFSDEETDEAGPTRPGSAYGLSKVRAEKQVVRLMESGRSRTIILRIGNVFGHNASMRFDAVINRFVFEAKYHGRVYVHGRGEQIRPFIAVSDVARVLAGVLDDESISGLHNVFTENVSIGELADALRTVFPELEIQFVDRHVPYGSLRLRRNEMIDRLLQGESAGVLEQMRDTVSRLSF